MTPKVLADEMDFFQPGAVGDQPDAVDRREPDTEVRSHSTSGCELDAAIVFHHTFMRRWKPEDEPAEPREADTPNG